MTPNGPSKAPPNRFEGEISCLGMSEIIQLNVLNRFSGCIEIHYDERHGLIFLRDGAIIHAEQDGTIGEAAFYEIVSWPGGRFSFQENVVTTRSTIQKTCQFLLLEAHRLMDERRAGRSTERAAAAPQRAAPTAAAAAKPTSVAALLEKLRGIPGVASAVVQAKNGGTPGEGGYEAEVLGGQALYVATIGRQLGDTLQAGEVHSVIVKGTTKHLLVFAGKAHYVAVLAEADAPVGEVEAKVRSVLTAKR